RTVVRNTVPRSAVVDGENAKRIIANLPCQARSKLRIFNAPSKEKIDGGFKEIRILQEERPLFWEKNFIPLVDSNLWLVRLYLAEIRINSNVQHQVVVQNELGVKSPTKFRRPAIKLWCRIVRVQGAKRTKRSVGIELHVAPGRNLLEPLGDGSMGQSPFHPTRDAWPEVVLILPQNSAI